MLAYQCMLALKNVIRNVQGNQEGLPIFETNLLMVFTDYIVLLGEKKSTIQTQ